LRPALPAGASTAIVASERRGDAVFYRFGSQQPSGRLRLGEDSNAFILQARTVVLNAARFGLGADLERLLALLDASNAIRCYDPNPRHRDAADITAHRKEFARIIAHVDIVKLSTEDLPALEVDGSDEGIRGLLECGPRAIVLTDGPRGARVITADLDIREPTRVAPDDVIDPMGAGDATLASFAVGLVEHGWPAGPDDWSMELYRAMITAGLACRASGGAASMPTRADVDAAITS
jgi:fructokinase